MRNKTNKIQSKGINSTFQGEEIHRKKQDPPTIGFMFVKETPWGRFGEKLEPVRYDCETETNTKDEEGYEDSKKIENKGELEPKTSGKPLDQLGQSTITPQPDLRS